MKTVAFIFGLLIFLHCLLTDVDQQRLAHNARAQKVLFSSHPWVNRSARAMICS